MKEHFINDLNGFEVFNKFREENDRHKSYELYCGDELIYCGDNNIDIRTLNEKVEIYKFLEKMWSIKLLNTKVDEADKICLKNLSLIELKKEIAKLANKYELDSVVWPLFNISNTDSENSFSFAIDSAFGREYTYKDVVIQIIDDEHDDHNNENISDYEKNSNRWCIEYTN